LGRVDGRKIPGIPEGLVCRWWALGSGSGSCSTSSRRDEGGALGHSQGRLADSAGLPRQKRLPSSLRYAGTSRLFLYSLPRGWGPPRSGTAKRFRAAIPGVGLQIPRGFLGRNQFPSPLRDAVASLVPLRRAGSIGISFGRCSKSKSIGVSLLLVAAPRSPGAPILRRDNSPVRAGRAGGGAWRCCRRIRARTRECAWSHPPFPGRMDSGN